MRIAKVGTVIIEGIPGSGKTTLTELIRNGLEGTDNVVLDKNSPAITASKKLHALLGSEGNPISNALLYQALRWASLEPISNKHDFVVINQFLHSCLANILAYARTKKIKINEEQTRAFIFRPFGLDLNLFDERTYTILLDCEPEEVRRRLESSDRTDNPYVELKFLREARSVLLEEIGYLRSPKIIMRGDYKLADVADVAISHVRSLQRQAA
ncbi:MAG: AAA family ATPase [Candidatus Woesearchaeota archaeon]|nr:MAG: AAA family ATPase [Candidatus Woesearchaeota archaeon]